MLSIIKERVDVNQDGPSLIIEAPPYNIQNPYIKSRGTKMSANVDITVETRGNNLKTSFSYMGQNVKKYIFCAIWGALRGSSMIRLGLSCFPAILSPISMCM